MLLFQKRDLTRDSLYAKKTKQQTDDSLELRKTSSYTNFWRIWQRKFVFKIHIFFTGTKQARVKTWHVSLYFHIICGLSETFGKTNVV